ncbi:type III-B CRISPR module RAMP protein Cmr1 [Dehalococcoidales bacterium]|nr:type III-B CRISPR module RAMP protein Cmr1 [Dehalococcoidales bacterium]
METLSFKVQVVTPLFVSGANQDNPEIRPPSIKGVLRFWYRAMMGGVIGTDLNQLNELEGNLFGSTETASLLRLRLVSPPPVDENFSLRKLELGYLGFGLKGRKPFPAGSTFEFTIDDDPRISQYKGLLFGAIWLLTNLGGLGARTRRGFGSLKLTNVDEVIPENWRAWFQLPSKKNDLKNELVNYFKRGITSIRQVYKEFAGGKVAPVSSLPSFSVIAPEFFDLKILGEKNSPAVKSFPDWKKAMEAIYDHSRGFREDDTKHKVRRVQVRRGHRDIYVTKDYDKIKNWSKEREPKLILPIFGLPLHFQFGGRRIQVIGEKHERRASPLMFRVFKLGDKAYFVVLLRFRAQFLEKNEKLKIAERGRERHRVSIPDWKIVDDFFNDFPGVKVSLW